MRASIVAAGLLLVSCGSAEETGGELPSGDAVVAEEGGVPMGAAEAAGETVTSAELPVPALDGEGLRMVIPSGATRLIPFGSERRVVENAVGRALGKGGTRSSLDECGAGPMEFSKIDGLSLNFQDDRFVGWTLDASSPLTTIDGVGAGSTRAEIEQSRTVTLVEDSTLGAEFRAGGIGGFFDGEGGRVNLLYAGTQCFFR